MIHERRSGWLLAVGAAFVVMSLLFTVVFTNKVVRDSERRDCETLLADIRTYEETPPSTPTGQEQWRSKVRRYRALNCAPALLITPPPAIDKTGSSKENRS